MQETFCLFLLYCMSHVYLTAVSLTPLLRTSPNHPGSLFSPHLATAILFWEAWTLITLDQQVQKFISKGVFYPISVTYYPYSLSPSIFKDPSHKTLLKQEVDSRLNFRTVEEVLLEFRGKRFHFHYFFNPEEQGRLVHASRFERSQQVQPSLQIQDGNSGNPNSLLRSPRLACGSWPARCLLSHFDSPGTQKITQIPNRSLSLPVQSPVLSSFSSTKNFH